MEGIPSQPGRRAVVLVGAERQAHAIRRHVCVERARPQSLASVLFLRPVELARALLARAGAVRATGWEEVRRLRILHLFESAALADKLRYFSAEQLRSGQGYVDAFARTIADLEASGLDAPLAFAVAQRLTRSDPLPADRLHDLAVTWRAADDGRSALATTAQILAEATEMVTARPQVLAAFGSIFAVLTAAPSAMLLRFLRVLPECRAVLQEARPWRTGTQRWREPIGLPPSGATPKANASDALRRSEVQAKQLPLFREVGAPLVGALAAARGEGRTGTSSAPTTDETVSELQLVQQFLFETPERLTDPQRPRSRGPDGTVDLEEYPSIEDEIEATATWVTEQIAAGTPAEQIALVVPELDPYAALLTDRLTRVSPNGEASRVGTYIAGGTSLAASPAGMRLQALLTAVARGLEAEPTIHVLPALLRGQGGNEGRARLSLSRAAEIVYGAGIVGGSPGDRSGLSEWVPRLTHRRDTLRKLLADADAEDSDEPEKRRHTIDRQGALRWLKDIEPILPAVAVLQQFAESALGGASLPVVWQQLRAFCERWLRIPPDPPTLFAILDQRLQAVLNDSVATRVAGLAALYYIMDVVRRERRPAARFGEPCVFIGTASHAAGLPFAAVRVIGLAEGALPHTPHDDPIVPDGLRKRIEEVARALSSGADVIVPRLADHVLDDIHDVFRVMSAARARLALSAPRQWVDRSEREVSGIMLEVATALGRTIDHQTDEGDVPTAARLRAVYFNAGRASRLRYAQDYPLSPRALLASVPQPSASESRPVAVPAGWTHGAALALDRLWQLAAILEADLLGGIDGVVTDAWPDVQPPGLSSQRPASASGLTRLLECPHRFLLERILHLSEPASPPSTDVIEPIAYGSLFHAAAESFFRENGPALCRHEGTIEQWVTRAREIADARFEELRHEYPLRGADGIARERSRLLRQIEQLVRYEWLQPAREFLATELAFGDPEPVRLPLEAGELYVRGAIDRVDRIGAQALSVRDLKTGRVRDFGEDPINAGRDLQIGLYVLALEASAYAGGARATVAAYVYPSAAQEPERAFAGANNVEVLRRQTRGWLEVARQLLSTGSFPRTPNPEDCRYCPFVPACGDGAQQHSATKLSSLPEGHPLELFARFKRKQEQDEGQA